MIFTLKCLNFEWSPPFKSFLLFELIFIILGAWEILLLATNEHERRICQWPRFYTCYIKIQDNNIYEKGLSGLIPNLYAILLFRLWCSLQMGILICLTNVYDKNLHQIYVINIRFWTLYDVNVSGRSLQKISNQTFLILRTLDLL